MKSEGFLHKVSDSPLIKTALDWIDDGILIIKDSIIEYCNQYFSDLIGYSFEEIIGKPKDYFISNGFKPILNKYYEMRLENKPSPKEYQIEIVNKNKEIIPTVISINSFKHQGYLYSIIMIKDYREDLLKREEDKKREVQFFEIFKNTAIIICLCDLEGKIIISNKSFEEFFSSYIKSHREINIKEFFDDNRVSKFFESVHKYPDKNSKLNFSIQIKFDDKSRWLNVFLNVIKYKNTVIGILFSMNDITNQIDLQTKNEFEKLLLSNLMNYFPESIYFKDEFSRFIRVNKATLEKFNLKNFNEIIGKTDFELFENEHATLARDDEVSLLEGEKDFVRVIEKETYKDQKIKWVLTTKIPLKDNEEKRFGTVGISRDITEIRKSELLLEALFKISSSVTKVENLNELFSEIHSIVKTLMKADNFFIALYDEENNMISFPYFLDKYDEPPKQRKLKRGLTEYILRIKEPMLIDSKKDLELRAKGETELIGEPAAIWLGVPLRTNNKVIGVLVVQDYEDEKTYGIEERDILNYVSEQIALAINKLSDEQKLKTYSNELRELVATKDKLFSIIAHDLKSPIQGLLGLSELALEDLDNSSSEDLRDDLTEIRNSSQILYKLIENLLEWSRFQTGRIQIQPRTLNTLILVDNVIKGLIQNARLKKIKINNNVNPGHFIVGDENLLHSLFHNLIANSIKFTEVGGEININSFDENDKIKFVIEDNGIGIMPENLEKIFKFDSSLTTIGTNNEKGSGLGLVLCKEIVQAHKGNINLESEVGKGTRISFDLFRPK